MKNITLTSHTLGYLLILVCTLFSFYLISPIFSAGFPMNIDLGFHYGKFMCRQNHEGLTVPLHCPEKNAGITPFTEYGPFPFQLMHYVAWIFGNEMGFKLVLIFIYYLLPISAALVLYRLHFRFASYLAYCFLLLNPGGWQLGGYEQIFSVGLLANSFGVALAFLMIYFWTGFLEHAKWYNGMGFTATLSLLSVTHPPTFVFTLFFLAISFPFYYPEIRKSIISVFILGLSAALISMYWYLPRIINTSWFTNSPSGVDLNFFYSYVYNPFSIVFIILGSIGLVLSLQKKELSYLATCAIFTYFLWGFSILLPTVYLGMSITQYFFLGRTAAFIRVFMILFTSVLLAAIARTQIKIHHRSISLLIIVFVISGIFLATFIPKDLILRDNILLSTHPAFADQSKIWNLIGGSGRTIIQDTLFTMPNGHPYSITHGLAAHNAYTRKEVLGDSAGYYQKYSLDNTRENWLFNKPMQEYTEHGLINLFNELNIEAVIAQSDIWKQKLSFLPVVYQGPVWVLFATGITPDYYAITNGKIITEDYAPSHAQANVTMSDDGNLTFKVMDYANWIVRIDGKKTKTEPNIRGFIHVKIPKGEHRITFDYEILWIDYFGYFLTVIGWIMLLSYSWHLRSLIKKKEHIQNKAPKDFRRQKRG